ncbi:hypothetical protein P171DRAFT_376264 [Karstenula rhodostoma CBS 690.94]|uniref:Zn(2)-C6 fungal-type domain-containing protein n=1 Tax=Karstenula rhodostoma CBS 690.94 TaxID=1392251 RepID=A0A9P4PZ13_9PLEO|nr:hypothetical protein P171DRAFT_376264 [Karstenula rhodostoma CBS 690.94]
MSTPSPDVEGAAAQHGATDTDTEGTTDIPRRLMRVKVLYTFDDQNKSNCLARLPTALSIPTVSLDETTQIGVIELKTCIQAIVSASPELVARLGHDFTVYAYDFSEYETPLVGQGMLSWILASASTTPNAPAEESKTMVTGRVCNNILGLFSNGVKETLEVKLKLVPVPTCMQSEYVENMERYHSLSKIMPEGMDYKEWAEFLKANPAIGQLAQPTPTNAQSVASNMTMNAIESFNELMRNNSFLGHHRSSFGAHDTRASSPAMSTVSAYPYHTYPEYRPASQASFHSESAAHSPYWPSATESNPEQAEEGPPKKRARVTKAKRPKKTALGPNVESLRVTASTAASVRLHRPVPLNASTAVSAEQVPRAPTPRPRHTGSLSIGSRVPAPSLLRNASMEETRSYVSPYDSGIFSDNAIESADEDKGDSPSDTPPNIPSSPPMLPERTASPAPSSPELPMLPPPNDSGFASDMTSAHNEGRKVYENGTAAAVPEVRTRKKRDCSKRPWSEIHPGPSNLLPTSETRPGRPGLSKKDPELMPIDPTLLNHFLNHYGTSDGISQSIEVPQVNPDMPPGETGQSKDSQIGPSPPADTTTTISSIRQPELRIGTPSLPQPPHKAHRGLARSQTWAGEPTSDAAGPDEARPKLPRSGSGARRQTKRQTETIKEKLEQALTKGQLPTFCNNCGQIETSAWRRAYTCIVKGTPHNIELSSKGHAIVAYEILNPADNEGAPHYRIFKNDLDPDGSEVDLFTTLTLCNPCGLWLSKKNTMRPQEVWGKTRAQLCAARTKKFKKLKKTKADTDLFTSDAVMPESDSGMFDSHMEAEALPALDGTTDTQVRPVLQARSESARACEGPRLDEPTARAALERAFQSSPVGLRSGSKDTPIDLDGDLTPRPTRRLLFPSPRRLGEVKSLADNNSSPRSNSSKTPKLSMHHQDVAMEDGDKENCPPPPDTEDDDLAHLFESPKITPTKGSSFEDLLKTPTPGSRQRVPLTPMRYADLSLTTPSKSSRTPRGNGRIATIAPETPFTRQLNDLLSDSMLSGSPSQNFDLSTFTTFTPGRNGVLHFGDFLQNDSMSSDLPVLSSSPPKNFDFSVFEDPNTSTVGLWSGASIFDVNDVTMSDAPSDGQQSDAQDGAATPKILTINGISLDFSSMIEEVVGNVNSEEQNSRAAVPVGSQPETVPKPAQTPAPALAEPLETRPDLVPVPAPTAIPSAAKPLGTRPDLVPPPVAQTRTRPPITLLGEYDPPKPRCQRCKEKKKGCDRGHPCGRCVKAGLEEECIPVDEEPPKSPAFRVSAEPTRQVPWQMQQQPAQPVSQPCIPVDPALEAMTIPIGPKTSEIVKEATERTPRSGEDWTAQTRSPSVTNDGIAQVSGSEVKQEVITPKAVDVDIDTAQPAQPTAIAASAPTPDDLNTV